MQRSLFTGPPMTLPQWVSDRGRLRSARESFGVKEMITERGTSSPAWGGTSGPDVPAGEGPWSAGRALQLLPPLHMERALCLGDSCLQTQIFTH